MNAPHVSSKTFTVTVAGGVGTADFTATGDVQDVFISTALGGNFDWLISDVITGVPRAGETNVPCNPPRLVPVEKICRGHNTMAITNSANGLYTVTIFMHQGYSSGF